MQKTRMRWMLGALLTLLSAGCMKAQPFLYVANQNSSSVSIVNTATRVLSGSAFTSFSPSGVGLSADGGRFYSANANGNSVGVYGTVNNAQIGLFSIGQAPVAVAADATRIYVPLQGSAALAVFNAATLLQQANLRVGFGPSAVAVSPANGRVFVANTYSGTVSVVDPARIGTAAPPVLDTIAVPDSPIALAMSPNGQTLWVLCSAIPTLVGINTSNNAVERRVMLPFAPAGLAVSPDGTRAYVTGYGPRVASLDTGAGRVLNTLALAGCEQARCVAMSAAVSADSRTLYVANTSRNHIAVVDVERNEVTATINVGGSPRSVVLGAAPRPVPTAAGDKEISQ
jgi:YVTN family beta-propeller protein